MSMVACLLSQEPTTVAPGSCQTTVQGYPWRRISSLRNPVYVGPVKWRRRSKSMFVTGGRGFLGRHLVEVARERGWEIVAPPSSALDICAAASVLDEIREWKPTVVVHLAYRKDDQRGIVAGSANVARAVDAAGARLIHMSSDAIFAGRSSPYTEADAATPVTEYGAWKAQAEADVIAADADAVVVRTSLIYGSSQLSPLQRDVEAAATGRSSMSFFTDEYRCPIHAADLATAVCALAEQPRVTGVINVAGPDALDRAEFARKIATWMGLDAGRLTTSTVAASGLVRATRVELDTGLARSLGIVARPVDQALRS
jgi:dTDP-4-dehydrorhamnose reductase